MHLCINHGLGPRRRQGRRSGKRNFARELRVVGDLAESKVPVERSERESQCAVSRRVQHGRWKCVGRVAMEREHALELCREKTLL